MNKAGQVSIPIALVLTGMAGVTTGLSSYYASQIAQNSKVAEVRQDVAVLQSEKRNLDGSVIEIKEDVKEINKKIDQLLINRGIDPSKIVQGELSVPNGK
jgi:peptidoglycan hydrolase CwlO-like protein